MNSRFLSRRSFLGNSSLLAASLTAGIGTSSQFQTQAASPDSKMKFGLVTYLWGKDMKLPELIHACEASGLGGVETRTEHAHGVEPSLSAKERKEVRDRFNDSSVTLVGYGSNAQFHDADPEKLKANIELTKQYIRLMHDCGGSGVKVKPNGFAQGVSKEKTVLQIGRALNEVAAYGDDWGQEIRVEAHGKGTSDLPVMKAIFDVANHPNVGVCWNSNDVDTGGAGLEANFKMVRNRFAATVHVRELNLGNYPYQQLMNLMVQSRYDGWILLEARTNPTDKIAAFKEQRDVFERMIAKAQG
ncbi:MAG: sugar phosphate isomerase/epimerase [Verrucomicrobia bacterium]|jgi:endonuclease IV|nr:sugar phosphate isomerase/epimerase [Verrucomicrobiota bacterium]